MTKSQELSTKLPFVESNEFNFTVERIVIDSETFVLSTYLSEYLDLRDKMSYLHFWQK